MLGTRQSLSQRAKQTSTQYFGSPRDAEAMVQKRKSLEDLGRKRKRHSPPPDQVNFDKENLLKEVTSMNDRDKVIIFLFKKKNLEGSLRLLEETL